MKSTWPSDWRSWPRIAWWLASAALAGCAIALAISNLRAEPPDIPAELALSGKTPWGTIEHNIKRNSLILTGADWSGTGSVREKDGRILIFWRNQGKTAIGLYDMDLVAGRLSGGWGWHDEVELDPDGDLCGELHSESFNVTREEKK